MSASTCVSICIWCWLHKIPILLSYLRLRIVHVIDGMKGCVCHRCDTTLLVYDILPERSFTILLRNCSATVLRGFIFTTSCRCLDSILASRFRDGVGGKGYAASKQLSNMPFWGIRKAWTTLEHERCFGSRIKLTLDLKL